MNLFSKEYADSLDAKDPLREYRSRFHIPKAKDGSEVIYFSGNSLGLQPIQTAKYISQELEDWASLGAKGHFFARNPWVKYHLQCKPGLSHLVGARESEVVAMNSLTVNLHLMMVSFYRPTSSRNKILILANAFPSDRYAVHSQIKFHGLNPNDVLLEVGPKSSEGLLHEDDMIRVIQEQGSEIALILVEGVSYVTGQFFDLEKITREGHKQGCIVGFDLAHAIGNVPLELHRWDADFAIWCNYKYVNAGPGALGGCFVHERFSKDQSLPRFAGWWGHSAERRFLMEPTFVPMEGVDAWQLSNVQIFSAASLKSSLDLFLAVGMGALRKKSVDLTGYADQLLREYAAHKVRIVTPKDPEQRGCQLSLSALKEGKSLHQKLLDQGVFCDWREPDIIRIAPTPFYNSFHDVFRFADILTHT